VGTQRPDAQRVMGGSVMAARGSLRPVPIGASKSADGPTRLPRLSRPARHGDCRTGAAPRARRPRPPTPCRPPGRRTGGRPHAGGHGPSGGSAIRTSSTSRPTRRPSRRRPRRSRRGRAAGQSPPTRERYCRGESWLRLSDAGASIPATPSRARVQALGVSRNSENSEMATKVTLTTRSRRPAGLRGGGAGRRRGRSGEQRSEGQRSARGPHREGRQGVYRQGRPDRRNPRGVSGSLARDRARGADHPCKPPV
jgi:hypothetical protein